MLRISFANNLSKKPLLLIDGAEFVEFGIGSGSLCEDEIVRRSTFKNSNGIMYYLTLNAR